MKPSSNAVLLLAHGSPDTPEEMPEYLKMVTGGRGLPQAAIDEITHRYSLVGFSPLTSWTRKQAAALASSLNLPVYFGMRNWKPFIPDVTRTMSSDGVQRAVVICLAPQNSRTSVGLYRRAVEGEKGAPFAVDFVESWHDHPLLVQGFGENLKRDWQAACTEAGAKVPVIFTAHSVPQRTITDGDPYQTQSHETAYLVAKHAGLDAPWTFAFQSQGMSGGLWIGPTVEDTILRLKGEGHRTVFIQPIGFVCDHVEVLYDIDIAFREFAEKNGMRLWRSESLNDSPLLIAALADIARSRLSQPVEP
ncbi:MAG TPA: ferrochelatase [Terriglobales bacterium]|jgi:ferrochelatase